jgi:hypothetical protein
MTTMKWRPAGLGSLKIDWRQHFGHKLDPYLVWADLSHFQGVADAGATPGEETGRRSHPTSLRLAL